MKNQKITVLIIDDESPAREKLRRYVGTDPRFEVVEEARNGQEAIAKIGCLRPQLVLLDIQMPGMSGFDVLRLIDTVKPAVIFTTAFDEYAVKAFDVAAVDYLLKPINQDRLQQALNKVSDLMEQNWDNKIAAVLQHLPQENYLDRLAVRHSRRVQIINVNDIALIHSEHRLINIYTHLNERYWTNENLTELEKRLNPQSFMRIHRSSLINLQAKFEIEVWDSGRLRLHFNNDKVAVVSREYSVKLRQRLNI
jgi:two-component system LytT family response regulator